MKRIETWTILILLGLAVALYDLVTGWTIDGSVPAGIVVLGLIALAFGLYVAMVLAGIRDRKRILANAPDADAVLGRSARATRWTGAFAIAFCVLLFANCSSGVSTGTSHKVGAVSGDTSAYLSLMVWALGPLLLALLAPPVLVTAAQRLAGRRPRTAARMARLAVWGAALAAVAAFLTVPVGFFLGVSACDFGSSAGACAAGLSSLMNIFSVGSLALFIPYVGLVGSAVARMQSDRSHPDSLSPPRVCDSAGTPEMRESDLPAGGEV